VITAMDTRRGSVIMGRYTLATIIRSALLVLAASVGIKRMLIVGLR